MTAIITDIFSYRKYKININPLIIIQQCILNINNAYTNYNKWVISIFMKKRNELSLSKWNQIDMAMCEFNLERINLHLELKVSVSRTIVIWRNSSQSKYRVSIYAAISNSVVTIRLVFVTITHVSLFISEPLLISITLYFLQIFLVDFLIT